MHINIQQFLNPHEKHPQHSKSLKMLFDYATNDIHTILDDFCHITSFEDFYSLLQKIELRSSHMTPHDSNNFRNQIKGIFTELSYVYNCYFLQKFIASLDKNIQSKSDIFIENKDKFHYPMLDNDNLAYCLCLDDETPFPMYLSNDGDLYNISLFFTQNYNVVSFSEMKRQFKKMALQLLEHGRRLSMTHQGFQACFNDIKAIYHDDPWYESLYHEYTIGYLAEKAPFLLKEDEIQLSTVMPDLLLKDCQIKVMTASEVTVLL